jgi:hypothetical protein
MARRKKRNITDTGKHWNDTQRLEAVKLYLVTGNYAVVSAALEIPYATLNRWKYANWWKDLMVQLKAEETIELSARMKKLAGKALDVTEDRLENGNFQLDQKTGEVRRVPVNMKDAAKVATDLMTQQQKLEDKPVQQQIENTVNDRLAKLAEEFAKFAQAKQIEAKPIQTEYKVIDNATEGTP